MFRPCKVTIRLILEHFKRYKIVNAGDENQMLEIRFYFYRLQFYIFLNVLILV